MDIGVYHLRAGVAIGGGKAVFVRSMMAHLSARHDVTLYTRGGTVLEEVRDLDVEVIQLAYSGLADRLDRLSAGTLSSSICDSIAMALTARRQGAFDQMDRHDCLWTHFWIDDILASRSVSIPVVNHAHGYDWNGVGVGATLRKHLSRSKHCLANSAATAQKLREALGIDAADIVQPGVDLDRFSPAVDPAFRTEDDTVAILFVGRFVERKGIFDLVDAFETVQTASETDVELYLVGSRGEKEAVQRAVRDRGIGQDVKLIGDVPIEELPGYYAAADLACHPSHWESFAMVNIEAMACGTPVITSRLDCVEDYLTHNETGILIPPGDSEALASALTRLVDDSALRHRLGRAGHEVAQSHSWEHRAHDLEETFQELFPQADARTARRYPISGRTPSRHGAHD